MRAWLRRVDRYWFGHGSATSLGIFRILIASLCFINLCMLLVDWEAWFGERGFLPQSVLRKYQGTLDANFNFFGAAVRLPFAVPRVALLNGVMDDRLALAFYFLVMLAALLSALGLWTRVSTIAMAVGIVSIHHRNPVVLHGGDSVLRQGVLYLALAPCGKACSFDRIIGLWKGKIAPGPALVSLWSQRLIQYNLALIYFTTFWHKFGFGGLWQNLTATWYPARLHEFDRFPVPQFVNELPMVYVTTFVTLAVEFSMATLVFYRPLRKWVLVAGLLLHGMIEYQMNIPLFSFLICSFYIAFYGGEEVEGWARRLGERLGRWKAFVRLPFGMTFRTGPGLAVVAMDPLGLVSYSPGDAPGLAAEARDKPVNPYRASLSRSLGAWPLGGLPYLWRRLLNKSLQAVPGPAAVEQTDAGISVQ